MKIIKPLIVEITHNPKEIFLYSDFVVFFDEKLYTVPAGFLTDFASVPRLFWSYAAPYGKYTYAAVVHDYNYVMGHNSPLCKTREEADKIFFKMCKALGVRHTKAWLMYKAVRLFGRGKYKK